MTSHPGAGAPPHIGDLEADYELLGELGRGGMAVVYRARERATGRLVAIKVVRAGASSDPSEAHRRFEREARTVGQLQHRGIVATYAVRSLSTGGLGIVMDYVPGPTLKALIRQQGALPPERAREILRQVADALAYAHAMGVVHRDVKPENIFLDDRTGTAVLSDFGIARTLETDAALTQTGIAIGTPTYMSPEQIDGRAVDGRGDIYSLGLVGWEMLSGRQPWEGESLYSVIYKQKHDELTPIAELRPDVPEDLRYIVERALVKDREERWQSAAEMLEALSVGTDQGAVRQWRTRHSRRVNPALAAAIERDAVASETIRFRRDQFVLPEDIVDAGGGPLPAAAVSRRRALVVGAAALVFALGAITTLTLRARDDDAAFVASDGAPVGVQMGPSAGTLVPPAPATPTPLDAGGTTDAAGTAPGPTTPGTVGGDVVQPPTSDDAAVSVPLARTESPAAAAPSPRPPTTTTAAAPRRDAAPTPPVASPPAVAPIPAPAESAVGAPRVAPLNLPVERSPLAAGGRHTCLLTPRGDARCVGGNERGQLGDGGDANGGSSARVAGSFQFAAVAAGTSHSCGVTRDGALFCWGANDRGQLGDGTTTPRDAPVRVLAEASFRAVRLGASHTCALTRAGEVLCWGSNARGQLGDGTTSDHRAPTPIAAPDGRRFTALAVGWNHSCVADEARRAYCWGDNSGGQLGDGTRSARMTPVPVGGGAEFASISAGAAHSCALTPRGDAYCWGRNNFGQLGLGRLGDQTVPARVSSSVPFVAISAGGVHSCALARGGEAYCWGRNTYGQLGNGTTDDSPAPTRVVGGASFAYINASGAHSCASTAGGEILCWGYNIDGQLGDGTRTHRARPVKVGAEGS